MKLGITLEGGASRTLFTCGVLDALLQEDIMPDYLIGVSAGIAHGISYLSNQYRRNLEAAEYMKDKRYMGMSYLLDKDRKTYYNTEFVFGEIPDKLVPFDFDTFASYSGEVFATVTNIHTGKAEYLPVPRDKSCYKLIQASCALPVFFQPVKVGHHYYLDGGLADAIPFAQALNAGCEKNIVVLTRERGYVKKKERYTKTAAKLYRQYPNMKECLLTRAERYNACLQDLMEREARGEIYVIAPETTYDIQRTERRVEKLQQLYDEGYRQMLQDVDRLRAYLSTPVEDQNELST
ncbi:MAG: patatin family protein [Lachnospiraceae bacterium]